MRFWNGTFSTLYVSTTTIVKGKSSSFVSALQHGLHILYIYLSFFSTYVNDMENKRQNQNTCTRLIGMRLSELSPQMLTIIDDLHLPIDEIN